MKDHEIQRTTDQTSVFRRARENMVASQLVKRGIDDENVLSTMRKVPRHLFVPKKLQRLAYDDTPLPLAHNQSISQPYIVALMCQTIGLSPSDTVLEIGTGSGYQAAVLSLLCQTVYTIELIRPLGEEAKKTLKKEGYTNVHVKIGDGYEGWPEKSPFDAILVAASPSEVPPPLQSQLKIGGRLIVPLRRNGEQELICFTKTLSGFTQTTLGPVRFVPFKRESSP